VSAAASGLVLDFCTPGSSCASLLQLSAFPPPQTQNDAEFMVRTSSCPIRHKDQEFIFTVTGMSAGMPHIGTNILSAAGCFADHRRLQALMCLFAGVDLVTSIYCVSFVHTDCQLFPEASM